MSPCEQTVAEARMVVEGKEARGHNWVESTKVTVWQLANRVYSVLQ
jgi:hypothetical protein